MRMKLFKMTIHSVMIIVSLLCVVPMVLVLSVSVTSDADILKNGYSFFPEHFDLSAYRFIFNNPKQLFTSYLVTIIVSIAGTVIGLIITSMLAYAISRKDY